MPAVSITPADLEPFATIPADKAEAMITDAMALAELVAPCITDDDFEHPAAAKAIIRGAILRWHDVGTGAISSTNAQSGSYALSQSVDTTKSRRNMFWPSEITDLQRLCSGGVGTGKAFNVDTIPNPDETADALAGAWVNGPSGMAPGELP